MLHALLTASRFEPLRREAGAAVGEQVGDAEGPDRFLQKGNGAALRLVILDRQVDRARAAVASAGRCRPPLRGRISRLLRLMATNR
jgi:hypothetical protein